MLNPIVRVTVLGLFMWATAKGQCLTKNDHMGYTRTPDLSPILGFELDLFKELLPRHQNFFISPYSIWNALVLAYFGSAHNTMDQLAAGLRLTDKLSTLRLYRALELEYLLRSLNPDSSTFVLANKAYFNKSVVIRPCMRQILHSEIQALDFNRPHKAAAVINSFVEETTHGKIKDLCQPEDLLNANMALVNAAYFKGTWAQPFEASFTSAKTFTRLNGKEDNVQMMNQFGSFQFGYDDELATEVLELPYAGETTAMYIFLPYSNGDAQFENLIAKLDTQNFDRILNKTWPTMVDVSVPKFQMETLVQEELNEALSRMGMTDAFSPLHADFRDFSRNGYFALDKSMHKAFVEVDEEGTEAGAATSFISTKSGSRSVFNCNHPFLFIIRDTQTRNNLFVGVFQSAPQTAPGSEEPSPSNSVQSRRNAYPYRQQRFE